MKNGYVKNLIFDPRSRFNGCYAHPSYSLGQGLDLHGKLQPDALQHGIKGGKARIALSGQRSV